MQRRNLQSIMRPPRLERNASITRVPWIFTAVTYTSVAVLFLFLLESILEFTRFSPLYKTLRGNYVNSLPCLNEKDALFVFDMSVPVYIARHEFYPTDKARDSTALTKAVAEILDAKRKQGLIKFDENREHLTASGEKWQVEVTFCPDLKKGTLLQLDNGNIQLEFQEDGRTFYNAPHSYFMFAYYPLFEPKLRPFYFFAGNPSVYQDGLTCRQQENFEHAVLIKSHPLGRQDLVLVPYYWQKKPQLLDASSFEIALHFMSELGPDSSGIRLGYNSIGACADYNHLHFEVWTFEQKLPLENASLRLVGSLAVAFGAGNKTVDIFEIGNYPVHGLAINIQSMNLKVIAKAVTLCTDILIKKSIPHSIIVNTKRVYILPRQLQQKNSYFSANLGFPEISGSIFTNDKDEYRMILKNPDIVFNVLKSMVSISHYDFRNVKKSLLQAK